MTEWVKKRFWSDVAIVEGAHQRFSVTLDGRAIKTPQQKLLEVPTRAVADMIAQEWDAQVETIDPNTMPATRAANVAIDRLVERKAEVVDMLSEYGDSDLLCYRAEYPKELVDRQEAKWGALLSWAERALEIRLKACVGIIHQPQDKQTLSAIQTKLMQMTEFEIAAFHDLVTISGSVVIAFAVVEKHMAAEDLWDIARLDELYQAEQWGRDDIAEEEAEVKKISFLFASRFFNALQLA